MSRDAVDPLALGGCPAVFWGLGIAFKAHLSLWAHHDVADGARRSDY